MQAVTALTGCSAVALALFFQINKAGPFRDINPFGVDPYDAVGSMAFQLALLVAFLTFARASRLHIEPSQAIKLRLVFRGNFLVLAVILATLCVDTLGTIRSPIPASFWGRVLAAELWSMFGLAGISILAVVVLSWRVTSQPPPDTLTLAEAIDDIWILIKIPVVFFRHMLPCWLVEWVEQFGSDQFFVYLPWINPRTHPWRFAGILGGLVGVGLALTQLLEGLPSSLKIGFLVAGIYIVVELSATLIGFAVFGRYLGLMPGHSISNGLG